MSRIEKMQNEQRKAAEAHEAKMAEQRKKDEAERRKQQEEEGKKQEKIDSIVAQLGIKQLVREANQDAKRTLKRSYQISGDGLSLYQEYANPGSYSYDYVDPGSKSVTVAGVVITPTETGAEIYAGGSHFTYDRRNREEVREGIADALARAVLNFRYDDHRPENNRWSY